MKLKQFCTKHLAWAMFFLSIFLFTNNSYCKNVSEKTQIDFSIADDRFHLEILAKYLTLNKLVDKLVSKIPEKEITILMLQNISKEHIKIILRSKINPNYKQSYKNNILTTFAYCTLPKDMLSLIMDKSKNDYSIFLAENVFNFQKKIIDSIVLMRSYLVEESNKQLKNKLILKYQSELSNLNNISLIEDLYKSIIGDRAYVDNLKILQKIYPELNEYSFLHSIGHINKTNISSNIEEFENILKEFKNNEGSKKYTIYWFVYGNLMQIQGDIDAAISAWKKSLNANEGFYSIYKKLYLKFNKYAVKDSETTSLEKIVSIYPENKSEEFFLLYELAENNEKKIEYLNKSIRIKPDLYKSYMALAKIYEDDKEYKKSISNLTICLNITTKNKIVNNILIDLARVNFKLGNIKESLFYYQKALIRDNSLEVEKRVIDSILLLKTM